MGDVDRQVRLPFGEKTQRNCRADPRHRSKGGVGSSELLLNADDPASNCSVCHGMSSRHFPLCASTRVGEFVREIFSS